MPYKQKYYFFCCYHCGQWYYTNKIIKTKKCIKCNRSFQFKNSAKFTKICFLEDAIFTIKDMKKKNGEKELSNHIYKGKIQSWTI